MSVFTATIQKIQEYDSLHIVDFDFQGQCLTMISLELGENLMVGKRVELTLKPTHIALGKNISGTLSFANVINAKVDSFENGVLLSTVKLLVEEVVLESIVTVESLKKMSLQKGSEVSLLIKASELSIARVLS